MLQPALPAALASRFAFACSSATKMSSHQRVAFCGSWPPNNVWLLFCLFANFVCFSLKSSSPKSTPPYPVELSDCYGVECSVPLLVGCAHTQCSTVSYVDLSEHLPEILGQRPFGILQDAMQQCAKFLFVGRVACVCVCVGCVRAPLCSTSPPGGNQVDGLPPV